MKKPTGGAKKKATVGRNKTAKAGAKKKAKVGAKKTARVATKQTSGSAKSAWYVYGVVRDVFDVTRAPRGLDEVTVEVAKTGRIAALTSRLPKSVYGATEIERSSGEVSWLSPRAMAHDRVLTWAQENGGVIPLPMFSMWGSEEAISRSLAEQSDELTQAFERVSGADEFGVRIHRRDSAMLESIDDLDPEMAALRSAAREAPPGQRYLLERKFADRGKDAIRAASQRMARDIFEKLRALARAALARPLVPEAGRAPDATLVLNGAFLVDRKRLDAFRQAVGEHVREYQPRGLTFDFTGPWPPYNFVAKSGDAALRNRPR